MKKLYQKINGKLQYIDLGNLEQQVSNKLFHPNIYPDENIPYKQEEDNPVILKLRKPDSVLEITHFLFHEYDKNKETEYELNPKDGYFHVFQLPVYTKSGTYIIKYGFKDIMGNKCWRKDSIIVNYE